MNDYVYQIWEAEVERAAGRITGARSIIVSILLALAALMILLGNWLALMLLAVQISVIALIVRHMLRPHNYAQTIAMPANVPRLVAMETDILDFAERLGLARDSISVRLDPHDLSASPCIRQAHVAGSLGISETYVHVPMGFLKLEANHPEEARAILAHEVAHVRQDDWRLWAVLSAFLSILKWVSLPLLAISLLSAAGGLIDVQIQKNVIAIAREDLRDYALVIDNAHAARAQMSSMGMDFLNTLIGGKTLPDEAIEQAETSLFLNYLIAMALMIGASIQFGIARMLARRRAESERLADWAATMLTSRLALARALRLLGEGPPRWAILSTHLRTRDRLAVLESADIAAPDLEPIKIVPQRKKGLLARLGGQGGHRLFGWGATRGDWVRFAMMALAIFLSRVFVILLDGLTKPMPEKESSGFMLPLPPTSSERLAGLYAWLADILAPLQYIYFGWLRDAALVFALLIALPRIRRDDIAFLTALTLASLVNVAINVALTPSHFDLAKELYWLPLTIVGRACFFLPLIWGLASQMSLGRSLIVALLVSSLGGLVIDLCLPRTWSGEFPTSLAAVVTDQSHYDLAWVLALLFGDWAARSLGNRRSA